MLLSEAIALTQKIVRDNAAKLSDTQDEAGIEAPYESGLALALSTYSMRVPLRKTQTINCGANGMILTSAITGFDEGFISYLQVEHPVAVSGPPNWMTPDAYILDILDTGQVIRFVDAIPNTGDPCRIVHHVPHVAPNDDSAPFTVRGSDMNAVCHLAGANCLRMLSTYYGQTTNKPRITTDGSLSVFQTLSAEYTKLAAVEQGIYDAHMTIAYGGAAIGYRAVRG
jgi:hypothetical protein